MNHRSLPAASALAAALSILSAVVVGAQRPSPVARDTPRRDSTHAAMGRDTTARRLAPVTIVSTPAERSAPVSATHVDAAVIRQTPAVSPYDLLRQTAGLEVHEQGQGPGFASDASMRGFSSDHATDVALWIDGVPVNEPVNGHAEGYNDWNVLFPGGVQDVDVIRGPTSALFGNFALAGVVNVRTLERRRGTEVTASGGSFGRAEGMLLTGFDHGPRGGGVLGARYQREDGFRPNARYDLAQGHARLVHDLSSAARIDGGVELYGGDWRSPGFLGEREFDEGRYDIVSNPSDGGRKRRAQERVSLRVLSGGLLWRSTVYATQGRWQLFLTIPPAGGRLEGSGSQTEEEDRRAGAGATSALTWALPGGGEVTAGGETRWDRSSYESYFTTSRARDSVAQVVTGSQLAGALFVQSHVDATPRLRLDAGARLDALGTRSRPADGDAASASHVVASPKLGALVRLTDDVGVYGNVSRGFRSPDGIIADPALRPISAWAYESGVKVARGEAFASAALFRMDVSDEQTFNPVTLRSTSGGASRRQGLELDWRVPLAAPRGRVALAGDWTFNDARYRSLTLAPEDGDGPPVVLDGLRVYNTSRYVGHATVDAGPAGGAWLLRATGTVNGPYSPFDEPGVELGGYALLAVSGVLRITHAEIDAGVRNVLDRRYPELVAGHVVSPGEPRMLLVTVRVGE